ncbi:MAG: ribulose-phosphate 3-epimerase, ribulose-phosphate 3-epimerase [Microgenomates group bacterium GW2011_GWC1_46_16]|jgi:ribulose-phosphate 3-epimerase|uniref:Ribulose-phosphate 3-epimerase n=2 Tax=Candidatus Collieribacteriota TaxID=1752725 RepID=A0A1F5FXN7_9BACT|nr:MAG: Ribulose-phosphate 3-epimerase [Microgenomates group bacterium GW2011_GWF1_46_12]KKU27095.1 MAG: ribulose-phosphate 3-epimerase, ribulose-phosphate 3-epimerase [Microgenomates group bacterium GW2011_GWC1_46_16]KKU27863.1 MAG: Ribulose-phosphate 3-epimerase [Microgenomates group bacterium GW2011_GWF2_46_18]KKU43528.1 MAG: Ribulose-phosphate 3-epimerase [Microgenomates group bacterium GW2011_GWA1_46_7]KKU45064.1 MAG: Ribulose-phosphate 3-epimerase [Microgenomates group bacterium GW2011_GW
MITPIIMESELGEVKAKLELLREQQIEQVHFDIGDGLFSELLSITPADLGGADLGKMQIDFHLLVDDPMEWIRECATVKPKRIIGQIERMGEQMGFLAEIENWGITGGLALGIGTPVTELEREVLDKCKVILLMAVPVGTSGNKFDERVLPKIRELRRRYAGAVLVDGGINKETYKLAVEAGASEAGANSAWWRGEWTRK